MIQAKAFLKTIVKRSNGINQLLSRDTLPLRLLLVLCTAKEKVFLKTIYTPTHGLTSLLHKGKRKPTDLNQISGNN